MKKSIMVVLPDIRSVHNVGSIFRTADAVGLEKIWLTGITPTPHDRFNRKRKDFAKVSLGAEDTVPWEYCDTFEHALTTIKDAGYMSVAVEQHTSAVSYTSVAYPNKVAFIFGNEVDGLSSDILEQADRIIDIPMSGAKESLNVSVTAGVILCNARDN